MLLHACMRLPEVSLMIAHSCLINASEQQTNDSNLLFLQLNIYVCKFPFRWQQIEQFFCNFIASISSFLFAFRVFAIRQKKAEIELCSMSGVRYECVANGIALICLKIHQSARRKKSCQTNKSFDHDHDTSHKIHSTLWSSYVKQASKPYVVVY